MSEHAQSLAKPKPPIIGLQSGILLAIGAVLTILRFTGGLAAVTNLDDNNPWGIWISFDLLCGVALAAGGYTTSAACYIFGLKRYHGAVRPAILTAFLGYALVVFALHFDVGRPWRLPYPIFYSQGTTSLLFEVGLCVFLYLTVLAIEYSPAAFEWLGMKKVRKTAVRLTMALTVFGVVLSTLHQSSLGALFLIVPSKLHPLWYSTYLPLYFFVSSMFAGMGMVLVESTLSHRAYHDYMDDEHLVAASNVPFGFAKASCVIMCGYLAMKILGVAMDDNWHYLDSGWGAWFMLELLGFVAAPALMYGIGAREKNLKLIRIAAFITVIGIILNRFNVSLVAFNWQLPSEARYFPALGEIGISIFVVTVGFVVFRFIVTRMPIFFEHPEYKGTHH